MHLIKKRASCFFLTVLLLNSVGISCAFSEQSALAIFNLKAASIDAMGYNNEIIYNLISALDKEGSITVMPMREMQEMLFKNGVSQSDDNSLVLKAGKVLGVRYIFFGSVEKKKSDAIIHSVFKLMDLHSGRVVLNEKADIVGRDGIRNRMSLLAKNIGSVINKNMSSVPGPGSLDYSSTSLNIPTVTISNISAKPSRKGIILSWSHDPSTENITGYHIYRSENAAGPFQFIGKEIKTEFNDETVAKDKKYFYRIGLLLSSGKEIRSKKVAMGIKTSKAMPFSPLIIKKTGFAQRTVIEFIPSILNSKGKFTIKHYKVYRKKGTGEWQLIKTINKKNSTMNYNYTVEDTVGLKDNTTYIYAVSSIADNLVESDLSVPVEIKTMESPELFLVKDNLLRRIDLSWKPVKGAKAYILYRKTGDEDWKQIDKIDCNKPCTYQDKKNSIDGTLYQYRLTAFDGVGQTSPVNKVQGTTKALIDFPQNFKALDGLVKQVKLTWDSVKDKDVGGYTIYRKTAGETFERIAELKGYKTNNYLDKKSGLQKLLDGTEYTYYITTFNLFKVEGKPSETISARTKSIPQKIRGISVKGQNDSIVLQWEKNFEPDIKHYTILRKKGNMTWIKIKEVGSEILEYIDRDLKPGLEYQYSIFATDIDNLKGDYCESSKILSPLLYDN
ncbi:fibronectin type III domain-containing protein [Desulfobacula toluolica]|uniref:Fibronectin type III domain protein n=1 Tax=Desulfobacula toluolica (strain DSM 7467 / Tol2) TaxID=651182 RepID=K0NI78_DESTT|nr:fibronectin type III domain-containing protein [Desulfobacula toluolica]CCK81061.1 fibronectin type III domain protein [Desulfobacula toluolica Tol2]